MSIKDLISKATSEVARATERAAKAEAQVTKKLDQQYQKQAGRISKLADMAVGHVDEATKLVTSSAALLNRVVPLLDGEVIQRSVGVMQAAAGKLVDSKLAAVKGAALKLEGAVGGLQQKLAALGGVGKPTAALDAVSSLALKGPGAAAVAAAPAAVAMNHLLILNSDEGASYHFGLSSAAFDSLRRQSTFGIDAVTRLGRPDAMQAMTQGGETLTLTGAVYVERDKPQKTGGTGPVESDGTQLNQLRAIGVALKPVRLTTGYGEVLGRWYLVAISEDQSGLRMDGLPRKQTFNLEFKRYGDDYKNV
jgi:phage protein U